MKTTELRIGNLVLLDGEEMIITGITKDYVYFEGGFSMISFTDIKGIPLTEEWLLKFGFKKTKMKGNKNLMEFIKGNFIIYLYEEIEVYFSIWDDITLKYVHQLQNLYFALTGEELEIKTN